MILRSKLDLLLRLDLKALLAVQSDVTRLIEERVVSLEAEAGNLPRSQLKDEECLEDGVMPHPPEFVPAASEDSDDDDFLLTQFDQIAREKLLNKGNEARKPSETGDFETVSKKPDQSSPLKGTQSLPDSLGSIENDLQIFQPKMNEMTGIGLDGNNGIRSSDSFSSERFPAKRQRAKKMRLDNTMEHKYVVSLNFNPVTKKPWILEDFKLNEDLNSVERGRKKLSTMKLNKFYKQGGRPPEVEISKELVTEGEDLNSCEFENLRHRSKSPPGFGRLDFPNTQERFDDKKKSQEIIYMKTRRRFLAATCGEIPQQQRQYLFKSEYLNQLVEDGVFEWDDRNLKIFFRK